MIKIIFNKKSYFKINTERLLFSSSYACNQTPKPVFNNNVILVAHPLASLAGKAVFTQGGNAFDAAVAAAFSLSVV